jgi:2-methylcitrate dehydratase PrpD
MASVANKPTATAASRAAPPVTQILADFVATHDSKGWSDAIEWEAHRTLLNYFGCAIGASRHPTLESALATVNEFEPAPQATLFGRRERVDMANAAMLNGISSHTFDFDDTHLRTIIHPAGPVASAALALAENTRAGGRQSSMRNCSASMSRAGSAASIRTITIAAGRITGSTGMKVLRLRARLAGLDAQRTSVGIAASQPVGVREQFGTMTKALHPGAAARAGLVSALLAKHGYTASPRALEAPRGLMQTYSDKCDWSEINAALGERFEIASNAYKPFACGVVIHPAIDGCVQLRNTHRLTAGDIDRIDLRTPSCWALRQDLRAPRSRRQVRYPRRCAPASPSARPAKRVCERRGASDIVAQRGAFHRPSSMRSASGRRRDDSRPMAARCIFSLRMPQAASSGR